MQQMVKCPNAACGVMVPEAKSFCPNCGQSMEAEEKRTSGRAMDNMAATVVGFSLSQLKDGGTQMLTLPQDSVPEQKAPQPAPAAPQPKPVSTPVPAAPPTDGGGSKTTFIVVGVGVALLILLALLVVALIGLGVIKF
jgi:hypothetical protein